MMILKMGVMVVAPAKMSYSMMLPSLPWKTRTMMHFFNVKPVHCAPLFRQLQQKEVQEQVFINLGVYFFVLEKIFRK